MADSKQLWFHTRLSGKVYPEQCCWVGCLRLVCAGEGRGGVLFVDARARTVVLMYSPHASFMFWQEVVPVQGRDASPEYPLLLPGTRGFL